MSVPAILKGAALLLVTVAVVTVMLSAAIAASAFDDVLFYVEKDPANGLDGRVNISCSTDGIGYYSGTLYLPGKADAAKLKLSWEADSPVLVTDGKALPENGALPVALPGKIVTYTVLRNGRKAVFTLKTLQGSEAVEGLFIDIDESLGTIEAMNSDENHDTSCYGAASLDRNGYFISLKGRGNSTWKKDKKPYNVTFYRDGDYAGKRSVSLIDGVKTTTWSLLANALDFSLLRNRLGLALAGELGVGLESRFVDIWMNGKFLGNYLLTPKTDWQASDEGFILELDNYKEQQGGDYQFTLEGLPERAKSADDARHNRFTVKNIGKSSGLTEEDIRCWTEKAWEAIRDYDSEEYLKYIDLESWARVYLLNEFFKNYDIISGSILMHRDGTGEDDKLIAGPLWDLDNTLGRVQVCDFCGVAPTNQISGDCWFIDRIGETKRLPLEPEYVSWLQELGKHGSFMSRVYGLYNEYRAAFESFPSAVDAAAEEIRASAEMNSRRWKDSLVESCSYISLERSLHPYGSAGYAVQYRRTTCWQDFVCNLKTYAETRLRFLRDRLSLPAPEGYLTAADAAAGGGKVLTAEASAKGSFGYRWQVSRDGAVWEDVPGASAASLAVTAEDFASRQYRCVVTDYGRLVMTARVAKTRTNASAVFGWKS